MENILCYLFHSIDWALDQHGLLILDATFSIYYQNSNGRVPRGDKESYLDAKCDLLSFLTSGPLTHGLRQQP